MYHTYKVTFQNDEGERKSLKVEASGIIPSIQLVIHESYFKNFCVAWDVVKAEDITYPNSICVNYADIELIAKIEALGTWEEEYESFDVWSWNGKYYKIYKHE